MAKLTDAGVRAAIRSGAGIHSDGDGLTLTIKASGLAVWTLRFRIGGRQKELNLGRYPDISIAAARRLASTARAKVAQGIDPAAEKQAAKQAAATAWTFRRLADDHMARADLSEKSKRQRAARLKRFIFPVIGSRPAADVTGADVVTIVEVAGAVSPHIAKLVLIDLGQVFAHGLARRVVTANPTAGIKARAIAGAPPAPRPRVALTESEIREVLAHAESMGRSNALLLRLLLLTGARIAETTMARWADIDIAAGTWTIPAEHAKNGREFVIPLPHAALALLDDLRDLAAGSAFVFPVRCRMPGRDGDAHMEPTTFNAAVAGLCRRLAGRVRRFSPHDLRATVRSHLPGLGVDLIVAERCLNHHLGGLVAVYDRTDYLPQRRRALGLWSERLAAIETGQQPAEILPLRRA